MQYSAGGSTGNPKQKVPLRVVKDSAHTGEVMRVRFDGRDQEDVGSVFCFFFFERGALFPVFNLTAGETHCIISKAHLSAESQKTDIDKLS